MHPALILTSARQALRSLRYLGKTGNADLLSFSTNQVTFTLRVLPDGQLAEASYLATHTYYGDNVHRYEYLDYKPVGGYQMPNRFREYEFGSLRKEQSFTYDLKPMAVLPTNQVCPGCALVAKNTSAGQVSIKSLGDSLYAAELNTYNNRVLFLVGVKDVTVFEAPIGYKASQHVIDAIKQKTGGKPITKIVVTHHHPDHAGGLRAFVEQGASIVTTKENVAFFNRFVNYPHELEGRKESKRLKPTYLVIDSVRTFNQADSESFSVYFIGDTQHTKEHLVTYFPKQKVLFHGDLCFFRLTGESAASVREQAVGKLINRYKLDVEKIYGSWPLKGFKEFGTKADLNRKLELATK
ncbi:MBL fold metallo-hydrolase [Spirosoma utsteinense]|uniref:MBL fold metallo-hydrolase n=1 Tax=Spirosoma utsteinense TaxID=2585773 RepID=UPI0016465DBF|nr:MBL fold metallo-hydrolase [Spirosoma utsteinense]MBC3789400.1 glyoxylase-like metal-dependent hydrolase (beta-lactamase superfamily II) [Spirosoma utsteinense]